MSIKINVDLNVCRLKRMSIKMYVDQNGCHHFAMKKWRLEIHRSKPRLIGCDSIKRWQFCELEKPKLRQKRSKTIKHNSVQISTKC